jgi:hypothetical protein
VFIGTSSQYDVGATQALQLLDGRQQGDLPDRHAHRCHARQQDGHRRGHGVARQRRPRHVALRGHGRRHTVALIGYVTDGQQRHESRSPRPSPYAATAKAYTLRSLRNVIPRVNKGRITCDDVHSRLSTAATRSSRSRGSTPAPGTSTARATGPGLARSARSHQTRALTLTANAAISLADDAYIAIKDARRQRSDGSMPGFITSVLRGAAVLPQRRGISTRTLTRLTWSDTDDPEMIDFSTIDGNWIPVVSAGSHTAGVGPRDAGCVQRADHREGERDLRPLRFNPERVHAPEDPGRRRTLRHVDAAVSTAASFGPAARAFTSTTACRSRT